jgi:hypothetical protein
MRGGVLGGLMVVAIALTGCARPTGDFGRAEDSVIHDSVLPFAGDHMARWRGEEVSRFNRTDTEATLRDRAWQLVRPPHVDDWYGHVLVEGQRTRVLPELEGLLSIRAYYEYLRSTRFTSSEARYAQLIEDINADAALVGPFWHEARAVRRADRLRFEAADRRADLSPLELRNATARVEENARVVDWTWRMLRFRLDAYRHAIDRIQVETPSDRAFEAGEAWVRLSKAIATAELETGFAQGGPLIGPARPGRAHLSPEKVDQK